MTIEIIDQRPVIEIIDERPVIEVAAVGLQGPKGDDHVFVSSTPPVNPSINDVWVKPNNA